MTTKTSDKEAEKPLPFTAKVNKVPMNAPISWLKKGLADMKAAPTISIGYGVVLTLISYILAFASWRFGTMGLYMSMASGFVLIGPVLSMGLYSFSFQLEHGKYPVLGCCMGESRRNLKDILVFSFMMLIVFMLWARSASAVHIFYPMNADSSATELLIFFGIGSAIGAIFSSIVFTISAFSLPMLMDREADAITAVITSINAVLSNKATMFVWALIIFGFVLLGFATAFLGFVLILPLIGHATWHAYRDTVDASLWKQTAILGYNTDD